MADLIKGLIGKRIQKIRKIKELSQEEIAEKVGISPNYISSIERGKANPTLDLLIAIAGVMKVTIVEFFEVEDEIKDKKELQSLLSSLIKQSNEETLKSTIKILRALI